MASINYTRVFLAAADTEPMKTPVTVRVEAGLLAAPRRCATTGNRTLTNLMEAVLRRRVEEMAPNEAPGHGQAPHPRGNGCDDAA